jgi:hypothetical protein
VLNDAVSTRFSRGPAQQTSQPVPPEELSRQWCGTHHVGPAPVAFATHVWMKRSLAGSASILCAASAQAICAWTSHCFTKLKRAAPASLCSVAFALQVWSAAAVMLITKPQSNEDKRLHSIPVEETFGRAEIWSTQDDLEVAIKRLTQSLICENLLSLHRWSEQTTRAAHVEPDPNRRVD